MLANHDDGRKKGVASRAELLTSDGGVADDVVIAQGEQKDSGRSIPPDLVVGDARVSDARVGAGGRQVGQDEDAVEGVLHYQILGNRGVGQDRAGGVACYYLNAVN